MGRRCLVARASALAHRLVAPPVVPVVAKFTHILLCLLVVPVRGCVRVLPQRLRVLHLL